MIYFFSKDSSQSIIYLNLVIKKSKMLGHPSQLKFQVVSGTDRMFDFKDIHILKATCSAISSNGKRDTLIDSTAITTQLTM